MAKPTPQLIHSLLKTTERLKNGARYEWGHMGRCNCGHLIQTVTDMSDYEIVRSIDFELNEWTEHAKLYCDGSGHKVDDIFRSLENIGFDYEDVINLEYLSDPAVASALHGDQQHLRRNKLDDVILYMETLADVLEKERRESLQTDELPGKNEKELVTA
ncbi:MAG TPA: hypothetical protein VKA08_12380 [Balneolales bacterium]|jgi:hypothetical protein|nr:hypothetical protein [Balneolales bacterium]